MNKKPVIAIVDDDESAREVTLDLVSSMGFEARHLNGPRTFAFAPDYSR